MTLTKQLLRKSLLETREVLKQQIAQMVVEYVAGQPTKSYEELAERLGMSHTTLIAHLKRGGYSRPRGMASTAAQQKEDK